MAITEKFIKANPYGYPYGHLGDQQGLLYSLTQLVTGEEASKPASRALLAGSIDAVFSGSLALSGGIIDPLGKHILSFTPATEIQEGIPREGAEIIQVRFSPPHDLRRQFENMPYSWEAPFLEVEVMTVREGTITSLSPRIGIRMRSISEKGLEKTYGIFYWGLSFASLLVGYRRDLQFPIPNPDVPDYPSQEKVAAALLELEDLGEEAYRRVPTRQRIRELGKLAQLDEAEAE